MLPGGTRLRLPGFVDLEIFGHDGIWVRPGYRSRQGS